MTLLAQAFATYLGPLLKKHEEGTCIIWEDLEASYAATKEVMKSSDNIFVSVRRSRRESFWLWAVEDRIDDDNHLCHP